MENTKWAQAFSSDRKPTWEQIESFVDSPYWSEFNSRVQAICRASPSIEYSICHSQPGWNVKYKKASHALCTIYPEKGRFLVLVVIAPNMEPLARQVIPELSEITQGIYRASRPLAMGRWLMIPVISRTTAEDAEKLIILRSPPRDITVISQRDTTVVLSRDTSSAGKSAGPV